MSNLIRILSNAGSVTTKTQGLLGPKSAKKHIWDKFNIIYLSQRQSQVTVRFYDLCQKDLSVNGNEFSQGF